MDDEENIVVQERGRSNEGENITVQDRSERSERRPTSRKASASAEGRRRSSTGLPGGWFARDPPDWQGRFPGFMPGAEKKAQSTITKAKAKSAPTKRTEPKPPSTNPYQRPKQSDQKTPLLVGKGRGLYARPPAAWAGRFPALERISTFPFLSLPPELRASIYSLLLGGQTIHVDFPGCKDVRRSIAGQPFLCTAVISDKQAWEQHGAQLTQPPSRLFFTVRHSDCTMAVAAALTLGTMGVSKMVHKETSLVPFQENIFTFAAPQSLAAFLKRLTPVQQRAILHVQALQTSTWTMWESPHLAEPPKLPLYLNVKQLTIFVELCPANFSPRPASGAAKKKLTITDPVGQDAMVRRMDVLWSAKLQKVEVWINNTAIMAADRAKKRVGEQGVGQKGIGLSVEDVQAWTERIKAKFLPLGEGVDGGEEGEDEGAKADRELEELLWEDD